MDKTLNLDQTHLNKLMDPENIMDMSLYIPEGIKDPKLVLENLSLFMPTPSKKGNHTDRSRHRSNEKSLDKFIEDFEYEKLKKEKIK